MKVYYREEKKWSQGRKEGSGDKRVGPPIAMKAIHWETHSLPQPQGGRQKRKPILKEKMVNFAM